MSDQVVCKYCKKKFNKAKEIYVQIKDKKYAHASCYEEERKKDSSLPILNAIDITGIKKCYYCKKEFDIHKEDYRIVHKRCYAHEACAKAEEERPLTEKEQLDAYICQAFRLNQDFITPRMQLELNRYMRDFGFTYSGMRGTLIYCFEIKHMAIDISKDSLWMIPRMYNEARKYYEKIDKANLANGTKQINKFKPQTVEIFISPPVAERRFKKRFTFLDNDEVKEDEQ